MNNSSLLLLILSAVMMVSCGENMDRPTEEEIDNVDIESIKKEAGAVQESYYQASRAQTANELELILSEEGLYMGTDPSEIFGREELLMSFSEYRKDPEYKDMMSNIEIDVIQRDVIVSEDGNEALITDLANVNFSSMPVRFTSFMEKQDGKWKIVYFNNAFTIENKDLALVDSVLTAH